MSLGGKSIVRWLAVSACSAGTLLAGQATPPGVKPPATGGAAAAGKGAKASLEPLLQQGADALAAGQYKAARDAFADAAIVDPRNVKAHHGLALCLVADKQWAKAAAAFDKAIALSTSPDRALVLNAAAANLAIRSNMRAAKLAKDYLASHNKEPDEPVLNALGTALMAATGSERKHRFFGECATFYVIANQSIEKARPGYKRFGADWLPAREADSKAAQVAAAQRKLDELSDKVAAAEEKLNAAQRDLNVQANLVQRGAPADNFGMRFARTGWDTAAAKLKEAEDEYEALASSIARPRFPTTIRLVAMDDLTPPTLAPGAPPPPPVVVASAEPPKPRTVRVPRPVEPPTATPAAGTTGTPPSVATVVTPAIDLEPPKPPAPRKVRITQYAAAFPVAADLAVTSAAAFASEGTTLQLQGADGQSIEASLVRKDDACGLALVRVTGDRKLNALPISDAFAGGPVTCAAFPAVDLFSPAAQVIGGVAASPKDGWTVSLNIHPRLAGSPLVSGGKVVGVCVAPRDADRAKLPAATLEQLKTFLGTDAVATPRAGDPGSSLLQVITTRETTGE